jgi:hypothetical protein
MAIANFNGETFVAFTDIAGFKAMMNDGDRAPRALDALYASGFHILRDQEGDAKVEGLFVSDCGILFVRGGDTPERKLDTLFLALRVLNQRCFESAVSLTTSIAWGHFQYHERIEIPGIEKNPVYGNAYVAAVMDAESGAVRMYPTDCRVLKAHLPPGLDEHLRLRPRIREAPKHYYFEWMRP